MTQTLQTQEQLQAQRNVTADMYFAGYEFGRNVEDASGWETVSSVPNEMTRPVFLEAVGDDGEEGSEKVYFTVVFAEGSDMVVDAYAIDLKGNIFGNIPDMTAGVVPDGEVPEHQEY